MERETQSPQGPRGDKQPPTGSAEGCLFLQQVMKRCSGVTETQFALECWWFLLGHLGFTAVQTALLTTVINNIIINKILQRSGFRCCLHS